MILFEFSAQRLEHPPQEIREFMRRLIVQHGQADELCGGKERRSEKRFRITVPVLAKPIGEDLQSAGEPFVAVTKDISTRGLAFLHYEAIESKFLVVRLTDLGGRHLTGAIEVLRCRPLDRFFEVGGKFVTKLYNGFDRIARPRS